VTQQKKKSRKSPEKVNPRSKGGAYLKGSIICVHRERGSQAERMKAIRMLNLPMGHVTVVRSRGGEDV